MLGLYLNDIEIKTGQRVLHIAPDAGLSGWLSKTVGRNAYFPCDFDPGRYPDVPDVAKIDLCNLDDQKSEAFDFIIHCHVLEHTPCMLAYTLGHLHRMLKPTGRHIFIIPLLNGYWDECFADLPREERVARFSQWDHVRRFGKADLEQHIGQFYDLERLRPLAQHFEKSVLEEAAIPERSWHDLCPETVFDMGKSDLRRF